MKKVPLTVAVITKNEEDNIGPCLESLKGWADEVIVVDDESTDKTVDIAKQLATKVLHRKMENEGIHRNWTYQQAKNDWVLSLDADEMVTEELKVEIDETLAETEFHAFSIPLRNFIGDYWVKHSGWYPAGKLRLFMKSRFKYEEVKVHPRVFLEGDTGHLTKDIIHKGYPDIEHFLSSVNRQSTLEAEKWIETGRKMSFLHALRRIIDRFFRHYIGKKGFKDGLYGFVIAYFASMYQVLSYVKYCELKKKVQK